MNNYKYLIAVLLFLATSLGLLQLSSCSDEGPVDPIVEYGRRDYIWEEDSLDVPLYQDLVYRDMVGNSPDDIWLGNLRLGLWHYDGIKWEEFSIPEISPSALWLFEDNTLWIGTRQQQILKVENGVLAESYSLTYQDFDWINIFGMYGNGSNDIYAVGIAIQNIIPGKESKNRGIIIHWNGNDWKFLDFPELKEIGLHSIHYQEDIDKYFIFANKIEDGVILDKLFIFNREELVEVLSTSGSISLSTLNKIVYINHGSKVYNFSNNELVLWKDFSDSDFVSNFVGKSKNDFFNRSTEGIGHFNGIDYKTIYTTHLDINSAIVIGEEIFFGAKDSNNRHHIVIHGVLKK